MCIIVHSIAIALRNVGKYYILYEQQSCLQEAVKML